MENLVVLSKIVQNLRSVLRSSIFTQQNNYKISPNFPINLPRIKLEIYTLGQNTSWNISDTCHTTEKYSTLSVSTAKLLAISGFHDAMRFETEYDPSPSSSKW